LKRVIYLTAITVLINKYTNAQELKKGYIIKHNNEKVQGYLEERTDDELRGKIIFSPGLKDAPVVYNANELQSFGFDYGRVFQSFLLKVWDGKDSVQTHVFAKRICTGKIEMYTVQYENNQVEYILRNNVTNEWVLLKRPVDETRIVNGNTIVKRDLRYLQQLTAIKKDTKDEYVEQKDINYSKYSILANIKAYDSKYADKYPVKYYVERRAKLCGASYGFQIANTKKSNNALRVNVFRDFMLIERTRRVAFHQGLTYLQYNEYDKPENKVKIINFSLIGLKLQGDPLFASPFVNASFGLVYKQYPRYLYPWIQVSSGSETSLRFSFQAAAGVKFRLTSCFYLLGSCSVENALFCLNGGVAYYYSK
jgi:hypothetical protein